MVVILQADGVLFEVQMRAKNSCRSESYAICETIENI
jgi:hypothetical protein